MIAERTTTVTSSENWVRVMMCAVRPYSELIVPKVRPVLMSSVVNTALAAACRRASG